MNLTSFIQFTGKVISCSDESKILNYYQFSKSWTKEIKYIALTVHHSVKLCIHRSLYFRLKEKEYLLCWSKLKHLFEHPTVDFSWWPIQDSLLSLSNLQHISTLCSWHCFRSWVAKRSSKAAMKIKHPDLKYWYLDYTCIRYITNPTERSPQKPLHSI